MATMQPVPIRLWQCQKCCAIVRGHSNSRCSKCGAPPSWLCGSHRYNHVNFAALVTLAHNLAIGGALCEAFYDGFRAANGPRPLQCRPGRNLAAKEQG